MKSSSSSFSQALMSIKVAKSRLGNSFRFDISQVLLTMMLKLKNSSWFIATSSKIRFSQALIKSSSKTVS